jgi:hypothetical protein
MATHLSLPAKLVKKIIELEFLEMTELLPDTWRLQEEDTGCCHQRRGQCKGPITDILTWVECHSFIVTVLANKALVRHLSSWTCKLVQLQQSLQSASSLMAGQAPSTHANLPTSGCHHPVSACKRGGRPPPEKVSRLDQRAGLGGMIEYLYRTL